MNPGYKTVGIITIPSFERPIQMVVEGHPFTKVHEGEQVIVEFPKIVVRNIQIPVPNIAIQVRRAEDALTILEVYREVEASILDYEDIWKKIKETLLTTGAIA